MYDPVLKDIDQYTLEEPSPMLESNITLGDTIAMSEWLYRVRKGEFFQTFHFPSMFAGPDIVFCLKRQKEDGTFERILCAFQVSFSRIEATYTCSSSS